MDLKLFNFFAVVILIGSSLCLANSISDQQLVELAKQSFTKVKSAKTEPECKAAISDTLGHLNDSEKTRALALRMFEFDKNDGRLQYNADSVVMYVFRYNPSFITDPSQVKVMMMGETNPRRFYLLSSIAKHLMYTQKSDFVVEAAPMLFRHDPLARMNVDSEYYFESLSDASFFAYEMIVQNLKLVNASFIPPDEEMPYKEKIPILVKWLKMNYPGCENLGGKITIPQDLKGVNSAEELTVLKEKKISELSGDQSKKQTTSGMPWWKIAAVSTVLIMVLCIWFKRPPTSGQP